MGRIARISSGAPWETIFGYSRVVRAGGWVMVSGTTSFDSRGNIVGVNQMYVQARQAISNIAAALERAGLSLTQVVRTRVFVTDLGRFREVARAHQEAFGANPPASSAIEIRRLVHPDMLIEIEADAYDDSDGGDGGVIAEGAAAARSGPAKPAPLGRAPKKSVAAKRRAPVKAPRHR
ncbi:MAG: RidA family protein [Candidatus Binataceae bacterium]